MCDSPTLTHSFMTASGAKPLLVGRLGRGLAGQCHRKSPIGGSISASRATMVRTIFSLLVLRLKPLVIMWNA
jgi:hypothetical protein